VKYDCTKFMCIISPFLNILFVYTLHGISFSKADVRTYLSLFNCRELNDLNEVPIQSFSLFDPVVYVVDSPVHFLQKNLSATSRLVSTADKFL
jgi:hypothetical protein